MLGLIVILHHDICQELLQLRSLYTSLYDDGMTWICVDYYLIVPKVLYEQFQGSCGSFDIGLQFCLFCIHTSPGNAYGAIKILIKVWMILIWLLRNA